MALHESGHSLGVLADEYEDPAPVTPFEAPNSTQETNRNFIRWHDWILASTFIPTPETPGNGALIGLFEGANYNTRGWYRPKLNCKMRDLGVPFCEVCAESLVVNIYRRLSLIDSISPDPDESIPLTTAGTKGFSVTALQPAALTVSAQWFLDDVAVPGALLVANDDWRSDQEAEIAATGLAPANDAESAIVPLSPGAYTAIVRGGNGATGVALIEAYQLDN